MTKAKNAVIAGDFMGKKCLFHLAKSLWTLVVYQHLN